MQLLLDIEPPTPTAPTNRQISALVRRCLRAFQHNRELITDAWREHLAKRSLAGDHQHLGEPPPHWFVVDLGLLTARSTRLIRSIERRRRWVQLDLHMGGPEAKPRSVWGMLSRWAGEGDGR